MEPVSKNLDTPFRAISEKSLYRGISPSGRDGEDKQGFTLIELVIAIGLIGLIATFGLLLSFDFYRSFSFLSEQRIIVSVLQKARNQAMSNVNEKPHGVHFVHSDCYIIFEDTYDGTGCGSSTNEVIKISYSVTTSGMDEVIFDQLSGDATITPANTDLTVSSSGQSATIEVNPNGRIDVQ